MAFVLLEPESAARPPQVRRRRLPTLGSANARFEVFERVSRLEPVGHILLVCEFREAHDANGLGSAKGECGLCFGMLGSLVIVVRQDDEVLARKI